jgi:flagellar motor component MotA
LKKIPETDLLNHIGEKVLKMAKLSLFLAFINGGIIWFSTDTGLLFTLWSILVVMLAVVTAICILFKTFTYKK